MLSDPKADSSYTSVICIAEGEGVIQAIPAIKNFRASGKRILSIIGAGSKNDIIKQEQVKILSDEVFFATADGSYGRKGSVVDTLKDILEVIEKSTHTIYPELIYCRVQPVTLQEILELAYSYKIKTITE